MPEISQDEAAKQYGSLIGQLPGVINSNIVFSGGEIAELHVLSDTRRSPKQIVRDIQSALMAQYGVNVDHRVISVAQIPAESGRVRRGRLIFEEIRLSKSKGTCSATVVLSDGETAFEGTASCMNDCWENYKTISSATLRAIEDYLNGEMTFSVTDVKLFELTGKTAAAVSVAVKQNDRTEHLLGSSFIGDDTGTAVVKATMDALNRKIAGI